MKISLVFTLVAILTSCVTGGDNSDYDIIKVGNQVPEFYVNQHNIEGQEHGFTSPGDFEGRYTLLVLFTTTCRDCQREIPYAKRVWDELGPNEVNVVCISRGIDYGYQPHEFWEEYNLGDMLCYVDPDRAVFDKFAKQSVPRFYLVNQTGKVVWMKTESLGYGSYEERKGSEFIELIKTKLNL